VEVDVEINVVVLLGVFGWAYIKYKTGTADIYSSSYDIGGEENLDV
jgi:hypothetical protein